MRRGQQRNRTFCATETDSNLNFFLLFLFNSCKSRTVRRKGGNKRDKKKNWKDFEMKRRRRRSEGGHDDEGTTEREDDGCSSVLLALFARFPGWGAPRVRLLISDLFIASVGPNDGAHTVVEHNPIYVEYIYIYTYTCTYIEVASEGKRKRVPSPLGNLFFTTLYQIWYKKRASLSPHTDRREGRPSFRRPMTLILDLGYYIYGLVICKDVSSCVRALRRGWTGQPLMVELKSIQ